MVLTPLSLALGDFANLNLNLSDGLLQLLFLLNLLALLPLADLNVFVNCLHANLEFSAHLIELLLLNVELFLKHMRAFKKSLIIVGVNMKFPSLLHLLLSRSSQLLPGLLNLLNFLYDVQQVFAFTILFFFCSPTISVAARSCHLYAPFSSGRLMYI
jgi:hypothetical protein